MDKEVSIVIVCMNRPDNLYPCLRSIGTSTKAACETIVVAYLFDKAALEKAKSDFPDVRFIVSDEIRGFSENNNLALREVTTPYCFIINDDTELRMPAIDILLDDLKSLPDDVAIVSPKLVNADGSLQLCGRPDYPARNYALQQFHLWKEPVDTAAGATGPVETFNISGAAFLIRTEAFRDLGWFDERYFFTPEDIALSALARRRGLKVYADPRAEVVHKWRATASRISPATRPAAVRGSLIFFSEQRTGRPSRLHYAVLGFHVWMAEFSKRIKAAVRFAFRPTDENRMKLVTFRHITRSIFTTETPKEIFTKYYLELKKES